MLLGGDCLDAHPAGTAPDSLEGVFQRSVVHTDIVIVAGAGRGGSNAVRFGANFGLGDLRVTLPSALAEVWFSVAHQNAYSIGAHTLIQFLNPSLSPIVTLYANASGFVEVRRGSHTGTIIATSGGTLGASWKAIGTKIKFDATTGTVQLRLGGSPTLDLDLSGQDTLGATGGCKYIRFGNVGYAGGNVLYDDPVWGDVSGSYNNTCPMDLTPSIMPPTGDTADKDFNRSAGPDNYPLVDDVPHDADGTWVQAFTVGDKDRYSHSSTPSGVSIKALIGYTIAKGGGSMRHVLTGSLGTEVESAASIPTDASAYRSQLTVFETDPDTSLPFAVGDVPAVTFGQRVAA